MSRGKNSDQQTTEYSYVRHNIRDLTHKIPRKLKKDYPQVHWTEFRAWSAAQDWSRLVPPPARSAARKE